jgi:hypothetical protein
MHFLVINRTRHDLTPEQYAELGRLAQTFYSQPPAGVTLHGDWATLDASCTYAFLECASREQLDAVQAPFRPFVDMEVIPVRPLSGWGKGYP